MENLDIHTPDGTSDAVLARPDRQQHPGILLYMDAIGLRPRIHEMAERIASWGYIVLAPNVFYRSGVAEDLAPKTDLSLADNREEFMAGALQRVHNLTNQQAMSDTRAYIDALYAVDGVSPGSIGTTGYCMGGRLSLLAACTFGDEIGAAAGFHAAGLATDGDDSPHRMVSEVSAELYFGHADHDSANPESAIHALEHALDDAGIAYTSKIYADAPHGYTMSDIPAYDAEATEHHFAALHALFARTLG